MVGSTGSKNQAKPLKRRGRLAWFFMGFRGPKGPRGQIRWCCIDRLSLAVVTGHLGSALIRTQLSVDLFLIGRVPPLCKSSSILKQCAPGFAPTISAVLRCPMRGKGVGF